MKRITFLYPVFIFVICSTAYSMGTGLEMLSVCGSAVKVSDGIKVTESEGLDSLLCVAYLSGFADAITLSSQSTKPQEPKICFPRSGASNEQLARIVVKWLREHPENLHESARMEVMLSLNHAFPCK